VTGSARRPLSEDRKQSCFQSWSNRLMLGLQVAAVLVGMTVLWGAVLWVWADTLG
jgi:hypothetical protein